MTVIELARVLAANIPTVARHPQAGECVADIKQLLDNIERMINRPVPPRFCGVCTGRIGYGIDLKYSRRCATRLYAPRAATLVRCPTCGTTHDIKTLFGDTMDESGEVLLTPPEVLYVMEESGQPIGESTFRRWRAKGELQPRGTVQGKPAFYLADVRDLRAELEQTRLANLKK
jgi:hypothetical protein